MDQAEKLSITLPPGLARLVRDKVAAGEYASNSEVIRVALRAWNEGQKEREGQLASIRARIDEALDDPRPLRSPKQVRERLDRMYNKDTGRARRRGG